MNYTNLIYLVLFLFAYYGMLLFVPYGKDFLQSDATLGGYWSSIPAETHLILDILLYIIVPLVAIAYAIISGKQQVVAVPYRR